MSLPRYAAYKNSGVVWLGEIPVHWDIAPLKRMLDIQNGSDHKQIEVVDGYPVIGSGGPFAYASEYIYDGESVLLGRKGTVDRPMYVTGKFWTVDTMYWTKVSPDASGKFCYYAALTIPFDLYSTNTALPSMTKGVLSAHPIARPPYEEQSAIAAFLDRETGKIDALIAEQEKLLTLLAEKRQATISHAVTRGLNPNAPMKDSSVPWLGEVPAHWEVKPLYFLAEDISYGFTNPMPTVEDGPYLLTANDIAMGHVRYEQARRTSIEAFSQSLTEKSRPRKGDVLITKDGTLGRVALFDGLEACINQSVARVRMLEDIASSEFVAIAFVGSIYQERMIGDAGGTTIKHIYITRLGKMSLALPPLPEQAVIVEFLRNEIAKLGNLEREAYRAILLLKERRSALIAAAVTGKIDVRQAA